MKLEISFSALWDSARKMGVYTSDFSLNETRLEEFTLDSQLGSRAGLEVDLDALDTTTGVLSYAGQQVLLFIPDQGYDIQDVLSGDKEGRKFHVADCSTLNKMRNNKRFSRYKVTNNLSGTFEVYGYSNHSGSVSGEAELKVCKCCLSYLNYKGYVSGGIKNAIYTEFSISEFLSEYSTLFSSTPDRRNFIEAGGYSDDWEHVSRIYRDSVGWSCESCKVNLVNDKRLLHTHHINGNKRDNVKENLKALCVDCHRKEDMHDHMWINRSDMDKLMRLRKQQGLLAIHSWVELRNIADKSLDGLLRYYEKKSRPLPELCYELSLGISDEKIVLDVAWPRLKKAIVFSDRNINKLTLCGWDIQTMAMALQEMNG